MSSSPYQADHLKNDVHDYWNRQACNARFAKAEKFSLEYFEEIENERYALVPLIFSFAQFPRYHGKKILEVGVGAGTDFLQWVRVGARAHGVDLTQEAVDHAQKRLSAYGLRAEEVRVADCESLPHPDNTFDLVYSFGVIHHTPDTAKAMLEIVRVTRPGGQCKVMIYNRYSLQAFHIWVRNGLRRLKPWRSISWCLYHHLESVGTKAYTVEEVRAMLADSPVESLTITPVLTYYDLLVGTRPITQWIARRLAGIFGNRLGWFLLIEFRKSSTDVR